MMPHFPEGETSAENTVATERFARPVGPQRETYEARLDRLRIKDRRRRYLQMHPEYFESSSLELADPLLYDRMVRQFQSTGEREAEGRLKGYSGKLEADLMRSEAKIQALNNPDPNSPLVYRRDAQGSISALDQDEEDRPQSRDEAKQKWISAMEYRFLRGEDKEFDYRAVDDHDVYDDREEDLRARHELYFDKQEEEFLGEGERHGETGIQDF